MTRRTSSATRRMEVSRSSVVLTTSATSSNRGSTRVICSVWVPTASTLSMIAAELPWPRARRSEGTWIAIEWDSDYLFGFRGASQCRKLLFARDDVLWSPQQRPFDIGIGECADRLACRVGVFVGSRIRRFDRSVAVQHFEDLTQRHRLKRPFLQHRFDPFAF